MVAVGLSTIDPLDDVDAKVPGVTVTLVAPVAVQLSVVLVPAVMAAGLAVNAEIVGAGTCGVVGNGDVQPVNPATPGRLPNRTSLSQITSSIRALRR